METGDLINSIQAATGRNMRKFFDQYVYGPGHPDYTVNYWWDDKKKEAQVRVQQKPVGNNTFFSLPLVLRFITGAGSKDFTETVSEKNHTFKYKFPREPRDFRLDPDFGLLKTAEIIKPYRLWLHQLKTDPHAVGRAESANQIAKVVNEESLQALKAAFNKEKFWGTARDIAAAIGSLQTDPARIFLLQALKTAKNPKVRRGVAEALGNFKDPETLARLSQTAERDPSYFVSSEAVRSAARSKSPQAEKIVGKALKRESWNDTIRAGAVSAMAGFPGGKALEALRSFSRYGQSLSCRIAAVQSMGRLAKSFPELFADLIALAQDPQVRVKHTAISTLGSLKDPRAAKTLEAISKDKALPYRTQALAEDAVLKINPKNDG